MQIKIEDAKQVIEKLAALIKEQKVQHLNEKMAGGIHVHGYFLQKDNDGYSISLKNKVVVKEINLLSVALLCIKLHSLGKHHEMKLLLLKDKEYGKYSVDMLYYKRKMLKNNEIEKMVAEDRYLETTIRMTHIKDLMKSKMVF